jgi:glycosyltransferase involved in cell wall biosynthesis
VRILMLSQFYPPTLGGEEQHVRALSHTLHARGHTVAVATTWSKGLAAVEDDGGVTVFRLRGTIQRAGWLYREDERRHAPPAPDPELAWALRCVVAQTRPQIVHAHNWLIHSFLPLKAALQTRVVLTLHDYSLICAKKRLMYRESPCAGPGPAKCLRCAVHHYGVAKGAPTVLANWAMGLAERAVVDRFLAVSRAVAAGNRLAERGLPYEVLPNFVPDDVATPRSVYEAYTDRLPQGDFLLFAGDLSRDKGLGVLLTAYAALLDAPPLVLIGRPCPDTPANLPPGVIVLPAWPREAVMEAWRRCLFGVAPSIWPEPCPTVVMEAMASGRPVVGSRIGGLPDLIVDGETGVLVAPGDPEALRLASARLLGDPALRRRMGEAGGVRARQFMAGTVVPRIEALYQHLLGNSTGASAAPKRDGVCYSGSRI